MSPSGKRRLDRANSKAEATTGQGSKTIASESERHGAQHSDNSKPGAKPSSSAWKPTEVTRLLGLLLLSVMTTIALVTNNSFAPAFVVTSLTVFASLFGVVKIVKDSLF